MKLTSERVNVGFHPLKCHPLVLEAEVAVESGVLLVVGQVSERRQPISDVHPDFVSER
jgi:hypothetical protein